MSERPERGAMTRYPQRKGGQARLEGVPLSEFIARCDILLRPVGLKRDFQLVGPITRFLLNRQNIGRELGSAP